MEPACQSCSCCIDFCMRVSSRKKGRKNSRFVPDDFQVWRFLFFNKLVVSQKKQNRYWCYGILENGNW